MRKRIIPQSLLRAMREKGVKKTETAFFAEIDNSRFSRICNGWLIPNENERERIAEFLGFSKDALFEELGQHAPTQH